MTLVKPIVKKTGKHDREHKVLMGLIDHYIKTGKPVGSNTLKEVGFEDLSSATIRNYFANLEKEGFLHQQHSSGGRIPTNKAFRLYADEYHLDNPNHEKLSSFKELHSTETREIASYLQNAAEQLAEITHLAVFLSAPRFEQDFITDIKLVAIDPTRCLCVLITDFGEIMTELLYTKQKLNAFSSKRIEAYFNWRLSGKNKPENITKEEEDLAQGLYNELMIRFIVNYTNFGNEEVYRTGFSRLLDYAEYFDASLLANALAIFENTHGIRLMLTECSKFNKLKFWIGDELLPYSPKAVPNSSVIAVPYHVNKQAVGAVGVLGPVRIPYRSLFELLNQFSESISHSLTSNLYKFKIAMRQPKQEAIDLNKDFNLIGQTRQLLLEDKTYSEQKTSHNTLRRK